MEPIPQSLASIAFLIRRCAHLRLEGRRNTSAQKRHEIAISRRSRLQSRVPRSATRHYFLFFIFLWNCAGASSGSQSFSGNSACLYL